MVCTIPDDRRQPHQQSDPISAPVDTLRNREPEKQHHGADGHQRTCVTRLIDERSSLSISDAVTPESGVRPDRLHRRVAARCLRGTL